MSSRLILEQTLTNIANAIRTKAGTVGAISPVDMPQAITDLPSGGGDTINDVLLEKTVTEYINNDFEGDIPGYLFYQNDVIERVELRKVQHTGSSIFSYCSALKSVDMPALMRVDNYAFQSTALEAVSFPNVGSVSYSSFNNCKKLKTVSLPNCTTAGEQTFKGCSALETISVPKLTRLTADMLQECTSLTQFEGESVVQFDYRVFNGDSLLELVDVGRALVGTTTAPSYIYGGFNNCSALKALVLRNPNGVHYFGGGTGIFSGTPIASGTGYIYVPRALVSNYESATNWSTFVGQFRAIEDYTVDGTLTGDFVMPA